MGNGHESLGHNGKTVGVVSTDVRGQSDCVKLNVSCFFSFPTNYCVSLPPPPRTILAATLPYSSISLSLRPESDA